ncbi:MAG: hypothetical protein ACJ8FU_08385 [Xanthobacteraceae bacterium]
MTDDAARQAERQRSFFMECLALATHQYGMSASPADTVAAAVTYFNALNGIAAQCPPDHEDGSDRVVPRFDRISEPGPL